MGQGRPVDAAKRKQVEDLARSGVSRNQIAQQVGLSPSTVSRIAEAASLSFDRSATKAATAAHEADCAAFRAEMKQLFYVRGIEALKEMVKPHLVFAFGGKENTYAEHRLNQPPTADKRNYMTIAGIAAQRAAELERFDADAGDKPAVDAWLDAMMGGDPSTPSAPSL